VIWSDEVPLTAGRDPRQSWVTRRAGEQYNPAFTKPQTSKYMEIMAWGCIAYNYKSPLYRFNLKAPTPELRYVLTRPFLERAANGINGPKYAEWVFRGPLLDAVRVLEGRGRHHLVQEDNAPIHNNEYCDKTRAELGLYASHILPPLRISIQSRTRALSCKADWQTCSLDLASQMTPGYAVLEHGTIFQWNTSTSWLRGCRDAWRR